MPTITQTISIYHPRITNAYHYTDHIDLPPKDYKCLPLHRPYRFTTQGLQMPTITQTISIYHPRITNAYHYTDHIDLPPRELRIDLPPRDYKCLPLHTPYRLTASRLQMPTITHAISIFQFTFASTYPVLRFFSSLSPLHIQRFDFPVHFRLYISSASIFQFTFASTYPVLRLYK